MTRETFAKGMFILAAQYGDPQPGVLDAMWLALADEDDAAFAEAVRRVLREWEPTSARPFPTVKTVLDRFPGRVTREAEMEAGWLRVWVAVTRGPFGTVSEGMYTGRKYPTGESLTPLDLQAIGGRDGLMSLYENVQDSVAVATARKMFMGAYRSALEHRDAGLLPDGRPDPRSRAIAEQARAALMEGPGKAPGATKVMEAVKGRPRG